MPSFFKRDGSKRQDELVAGISVVRDGRDIIPYICGHYLRLGFDRLSFIDDGSSDGTFEFLQRLSRRDSRVAARRVDLPEFEQSRLMTEAANELISEEYRMIFPFDQDEFWNIELDMMRHVARGAAAGLFIAKWVQFVQDRRVMRPRLFSILRAKYRAVPVVTSRASAFRLGKPRMAFVRNKIAFKSGQTVSIAFGQHQLTEGPTEVLAADLEVFHLPARSAREIGWRNATISRLRKLIEELAPEIRDLSPAEKEALTKGYFGSWEVNSADRDGCVVGEDGVVNTLVPDHRLRATLAKAFAYMVLRHPILLLR